MVVWATVEATGNLEWVKLCFARYLGRADAPVGAAISALVDLLYGDHVGLPLVIAAVLSLDRGPPLKHALEGVHQLLVEGVIGVVARLAYVDDRLGPRDADQRVS